MNKINLIPSIALIFVFVLSSVTTFAQDAIKLESIKQEQKVLKSKGNLQKVVPQNKLTPAQKQAIKKKREVQRKKLIPQQHAQREAARKKRAKLPAAKPISPGGKLEKIKAQQKGKRISKQTAKARKKDIAKAKAIATINRGKGRAIAANKKLELAKIKLATMKKSGKYTPEQIQKKEAILTKYEMQLAGLKKSIETGNAQVKK